MSCTSPLDFADGVIGRGSALSGILFRPLDETSNRVVARTESTN